MDAKILLVDQSGYPYRWVGFERAAYYMFKDAISWIPSESNYVMFGGVNALTNERSVLKIPAILAIKNAKVGSRLMGDKRKSSRSIFRRDNNTCAYCGSHFSDTMLTLDHVQPSSRGGSNDWSNLVSACFPCNNRKGNRTPAEAGMPLKFKPYVPTKAQYLNFTQPIKLDCQAEWINGFL